MCLPCGYFETPKGYIIDVYSVFHLVLNGRQCILSGYYFKKVSS